MARVVAMSREYADALSLWGTARSDQRVDRSDVAAGVCRPRRVQAQIAAVCGGKGRARWVERTCIPRGGTKPRISEWTVTRSALTTHANPRGSLLGTRGQKSLLIFYTDPMTPIHVMMLSAPMHVLSFLSNTTTGVF